MILLLFQLLLIMYTFVKANLDNNNNNYIPKIIHQTWKTFNIPIKLKQYQETLINVHKSKGWEYRLWDDILLNNFVIQHCPSISKINYKIKIQFIDAARYCILYHIGGIFIDLDYQALRPLDSILDIYNNDYDTILTIEPPNHAKTFNLDFIASNAIMFSKKKSLFFKKLIDTLPLAQKYMLLPTSTSSSSMEKTFNIYQKENIVMHTTGPLFLTHFTKLFLCNTDIDVNRIMYLSATCDYIDNNNDNNNMVHIIMNPTYFSSKSLFTENGTLIEGARCEKLMMEEANNIKKTNININDNTVIAMHHWCGTWWDK